MNRPIASCALLLAALSTTGIGAAPILDSGAVIAALASNHRALVGFGWTSQTEVRLAGEVLQTERYEARFGADGSLIRTRVGGSDAAHLPKKRERKVAEMRAAMDDLVRDYVEADTAWMARAFAESRVTTGGPRDTALMTARDVIRAGDTMKIVVDGTTLEPRRIEIVTSIEGEPLELRAEFVRLPGGPACPARIVVETEIKEDRLVVTTENSDYARL